MIDICINRQESLKDVYKRQLLNAIVDNSMLEEGIGEEKFNVYKQGNPIIGFVKQMEDVYKRQVAYVLNIVRIYSIPLGFLVIVVAAIHRYVLGIRKLDTQEKGFGVMIGIITVMVICLSLIHI